MRFCFAASMLPPLECRRRIPSGANFDRCEENHQINPLPFSIHPFSGLLTNVSILAFSKASCSTRQPAVMAKSSLTQQCLWPFLTGSFSFSLSKLLWVYSTQYSAGMRAFASDSDSNKLTDSFHEGSIKHHFSRVPSTCSGLLEMHKLNQWSGKPISSILRDPSVEVWKLKHVFLSTTFTPWMSMHDFFFLLLLLFCGGRVSTVYK